METVLKIFRVDRREIAFLRFIFEGYDGIAVVTTLDPGAGIVAIRMAPGCEDEVARVLRELAGEMLIEPLGSASGAERTANYGTADRLDSGCFGMEKMGRNSIRRRGTDKDRTDRR